jgi:hypothetical protein
VHIKKRAVLLIGSVLVLSAALAVWLYLPFQKIRTLNARYYQVQQGMSTNEVDRIMGHDGQWLESGFTAWWDDRRLEVSEDARIRKAVRYSVTTFHLPVTFEFTFDSNGKTIGRHRYD